MKPALRVVLLVAIQIVAFALESGATPAAAGTLDRIQSTHQIRLGYFGGSAPFSFVDADKSQKGYSVDLCAHIADGIKQQLKLSALKIVWVPLTLNDRIEAVRKGRIDIECGTTSWSFTRQKLVDFSLITFVDGASLLATQDSGIKRISDVTGKRVVVISNTTTQLALTNALAKYKIKADVILVDSRERGTALLQNGGADAFASDRFLLSSLLKTADFSKPVTLIDEDFSIEPYALALPRNDPDFRLAVNRSLAEVFRSGEINQIYARWLAQFGQPSLLLSALYVLQAIPE
jgi:glutamate/aspartate transport system substrate-binding protein